MASVELEALEHAMGELLSVLRNEDNGPAQIAEAWSRCQSAGETINGVLGRASELDPTEHDELRASLDRLLRMNAIARHAILDEQRSLDLLLTHAREAGEKLRGYAPRSETTGESCDLAG